MPTTKIGAAYDARAAEYIDLFGTTDKLAEQDRKTITTWRDTTTGRLLDAGCGPGHWSEELVSSGVRDVVGLDASTEFVTAARERFPSVAFQQADLAAIPLENRSVGGILAWYSIIHTPPADLPKILSEFSRVLEPGGSALIGYFDGEPGEAFDHAVHTAYYWSAEALEELLAEHGFVVEQASARQEPDARRRLGDLVARLIA
ncbi:class I SAM-dependent methyltransferase [Nocardioides albus]|uniref:Ubiquinone/menaquinone biosynthesis C-methylase UbiE n=1 Tax=Nocardioides albus TaxID=1841 RepID=A0A7W5A3Q8_9ACTN|nr:class I SAM-dependent methyltransferase [Nocardioides albus]MBB3088939.1 ubiquinone/menaquinone biosynthesis C-methylase UbiE [Nocardioides albus]GGU15377.1 methyltransferase [Nocardioides albus]